MAKVKYLKLLDPTINKKVMHVIIKGNAYSLETGNKIPYMKERKKHENNH